MTGVPIDRELLVRAVELGLATIEELEAWTPLIEPDPFADLTPEERAEHMLRSCASGAPATLPPKGVLVRGRRIPPPPSRRRRVRTDASEPLPGSSSGVEPRGTMGK